MFLPDKEGFVNCAKEIKPGKDNYSPLSQPVTRSFIAQRLACMNLSSNDTIELLVCFFMKYSTQSLFLHFTVDTADCKYGDDCTKARLLGNNAWLPGAERYVFPLQNTRRIVIFFQRNGPAFAPEE